MFHPQESDVMGWHNALMEKMSLTVTSALSPSSHLVSYQLNFCVQDCKALIVTQNMKYFLAMLVALHFTPVSKSVTRSFKLRTSLASRLASLVTYIWVWDLNYAPHNGIEGGSKVNHSLNLLALTGAFYVKIRHLRSAGTDTFYIYPTLHPVTQHNKEQCQSV